MRPWKSLLTALALFALLTALSYFVFSPPSARGGEPVPDDVAPPLSFCIGSTATCVLPDVGLQAVNYDLDAKKWSGGVKKFGAGYALLFAADEVYASGVAVHVSFNFGQATPDSFDPTVTLVLARYLQFGMSFELGDGFLNRYLTIGTGIPTDLLSGSTIYSRLLAARRARAAEPSPEPAPPAPPPPPQPAPDAGSPDSPTTLASTGDAGGAP